MGHYKIWARAIAYPMAQSPWPTFIFPFSQFRHKSLALSPLILHSISIEQENCSRQPCLIEFKPTLWCASCVLHKPVLTCLHMPSFPMLPKWLRFWVRMMVSSQSTDSLTSKRLNLTPKYQRFNSFLHFWSHLLRLYYWNQHCPVSLTLWVNIMNLYFHLNDIANNKLWIV